MNEIEVISKIKREKLDERNYFNSLIESAYEEQMLSEDDIVNIQIQILQLLDEIVYKYNGLDSSSIRKEILEDISNSNNYTIGVYLKTFRNPDEALKEIKDKGVKKVYQEGRKKIDRMLNIIRLMYIKVKQNKLNIENDTYNDTIIGGIQGFLKIYNPDFKAQDMKITADYPLYNNLIGKLDGVEFIKEYLNSLYLENLFCMNFSEEKIKYLLYGYSHDYQELIINIFEIVLLETIACKLVNRDIQDLAISTLELNELYKLFKNKNNIEIKNTVIKTYQRVLCEIGLDSNEYEKYIEKNLDNITQMIINAVKQKTLDKLFIPQKFIEY
ncbi:MAG: DUF6179 domain-containing protein [Bacilli bacterium]|nr:DUF6179 domain-containing protein [Bacilli bacterium]